MQLDTTGKSSQLNKGASIFMAGNQGSCRNTVIKVDSAIYYVPKESAKDVQASLRSSYDRLVGLQGSSDF